MRLSEESFIRVLEKVLGFLVVCTAKASASNSFFLDRALKSGEMKAKTGEIRILIKIKLAWMVGRSTRNAWKRNGWLISLEATKRNTPIRSELKRSIWWMCFFW